MKPTPTRTGKSPLEVAISSGISVAKVYIEIGAGRLKAKKLGRRTVILDDDEKAWLAALPPANIKPRAKRGEAA